MRTVKVVGRFKNIRGPMGGPIWLVPADPVFVREGRLFARQGAYRALDRTGAFEVDIEVDIPQVYDVWCRAGHWKVLLDPDVPIAQMADLMKATKK